MQPIGANVAERLFIAISDTTYPPYRVAGYLA
jgi:hypothetical protein